MASYGNSDSWPSNGLLGSFGSLGGPGYRLGRPEGLYVILLRPERGWRRPVLFGLLGQGIVFRLPWSIGRPFPVVAPHTDSLVTDCFAND